MFILSPFKPLKPKTAWWNVLLFTTIIIFAIEVPSLQMQICKELSVYNFLLWFDKSVAILIKIKVWRRKSIALETYFYRISLAKSSSIERVSILRLFVQHLGF